ncbi:hypothetical protein [Pseudomonas fluorescens]|uniref:hypothetical protein n=1 Tax=Pseudomonas fluorescens TaxID=294 RepID=UPI0012425F92|nr:hypothetical protein [Pseudomonas fluorescens]VVN43907.1 hypothetical protein PS639_05569 [Pseudomonas fluorescens]
MMNNKALKAFAVICDDFADTPEQLAVAASDGVQLAVYATRPAAVERLSIAGDLVLDVAIIPAADLDRATAERDALQLRLNAADQRIDDLLAEIATVRLGPCKMIVGDELP